LLYYFTFYLAVDKEAPPPEETEDLYSEAEDGKPKPIPVAEFARYFKNKSENGAIVLREEFKAINHFLNFACVPFYYFLSVFLLTAFT